MHITTGDGIAIGISSPRRAAGRRSSSALGGLALATLILLAPAALCAQTQDYSNPNGDDATQSAGSPYKVDASLDWSGRFLLLRVSLDMVRVGLRLPEGRLEAERMIERDLPGLAKDSIFSLQVDSYRTVRDTIMDGSLDPEGLIALSKDVTRLESSISRDMRNLIVSYKFSLDAVGSLYVLHNEAIPPPAALEWRPTRERTGIVIVARGSLPVHGEFVSDRPRPCLFPRVFDDGMRPFLNKDMVDPDILRSGGEVGYAASIPDDGRVGDDPLLVMATQIFGTDRTDLIISRDDAIAILGLSANRDLLREGKVTIVLDRSALIARSPDSPRQPTPPPTP
ncbi:MAG: hypothetical protein ACLQMF_07810 [Rectinemataceae bacterium]